MFLVAVNGYFILAKGPFVIIYFKKILYNIVLVEILNTLVDTDTYSYIYNGIMEIHHIQYIYIYHLQYNTIYI